MLNWLRTQFRTTSPISWNKFPKRKLLQPHAHFWEKLKSFSKGGEYFLARLKSNSLVNLEHIERSSRRGFKALLAFLVAGFLASLANIVTVSDLSNPDTVLSLFTNPTFETFSKLFFVPVTGGLLMALAKWGRQALPEKFHKLMIF